MKKHLKISAIALALTASIQFSQISIYAEGLDELGQVVDGSLLTNNPRVEDSVTILARGSLLGYVNAVLSTPERTSGIVEVRGETTATVIADNIHLGLVLEQKMFGEWFEYCRWNVDGKDIMSVKRNFEIPVEGGYYYRLKGTHKVDKAGETQIENTITDGTWVEKEE